MKLGEIKKLCKASGCVRLIDELPASIEETRDELIADMRLEGLNPDNYDIDDMVKNPDDIRQWISDGVGAYPLDGLPYLDEESVCAIFDIDEKMRDKLHVYHNDQLPSGVSLADRMSTDEPLEEIRFKMSLGGDELALFRGEDGGLVVIRADYKKPIDNWKDCEFFRRKGESGVWVAVMSGLILRGLIGTYRIREDLVETLGAVYNAAGVALEGEDADNEGV